MKFTGYKQPLNPSPTVPQGDSAGNNSTDANSPDINSSADIQTDDTVLLIRGKYEHLNQAQQRQVTEWGKKVYKLALLHPREIILNGNTHRKAVSLTFDDGPDDTITPQILNILKANDIQATFCYVGTQMNHFPEVVKQTAAQGNQIINHTFAHPRMSELQPEDMRNEVSQNDNIISNLTGNQTRSVRPPYGDINASVVEEMRKEGKTIILWSLDSLDWADIPPETLVANILADVRPGDIILMHSISTRTNTAAALPLIIKGLREKGYSMVRIDQLTGIN